MLEPSIAHCTHARKLLHNFFYLEMIAVNKYKDWCNNFSSTLAQFYAEQERQWKRLCWMKEKSISYCSGACLLASLYVSTSIKHNCMRCVAAVIGRLCATLWRRYSTACVPSPASSCYFSCSSSSSRCSACSCLVESLTLSLTRTNHVATSTRSGNH